MIRLDTDDEKDKMGRTVGWILRNMEDLHRLGDCVSMRYFSLSFANKNIASGQTKTELEDQIKMVIELTGLLNPLISLENRFGDILGLGFSDGGCFATFIRSDGYPPYYTACSKEVYSQNSVEFWNSPDGHVTEIVGAQIISFDEVLKIAIHFCETGELEDTGVEWVEV